MDKTSEPGTARFGNFINYYEFNPPDRRIKLIPNSLIWSVTQNDDTDIFVLDVGCNAGILTVAMYEHFMSSKPDKNIHVLGVDLDPVLIQRCIECNPHAKNITFQVADILNPEHTQSVIQTFLDKHDKVRFDLVTCFSVTLWIHINNGDEKFRNFLKILSDLGSHLILEPQPWKCYKSAMRRMKKLGCEEFKHFKSLEWNQYVDDDILDYMKSNCGMEIVNIFGSTEWERKICFLKNNSVHDSR